MIVAAFLLATSGPALAQDSDLDLIPDQASDSELQTAQPATADRIIFVEAASAIVDSKRSLPQTLQPAGWQARISVNLDLDRDITPEFRLSFGNRISLLKPDHAQSPFGEIVQNDLRELFATIRLTSRDVVEVGRVNVRSGTALAFNPTDYFRQGATLTQTSADPAGLRAGRLGVFLVRYQRYWDSGAVTVSFAPKLASRVGYADQTEGFDLALGRTNFANSFVLTASPRIGALSPQFSLLIRDGRWRAGLSASLPLGSAVILYGEWTGGARPNLAAQLVEQNGVRLPALQQEAQDRFVNQSVLGTSWSNARTKLTVNLEYHFNEAGLGQRAWDALFDEISIGGPSAVASSVLPAAIAGFEGDPLPRHQAFMMISRQDAGLKDLTIGALGKANLRDGSFGGQLSATYARSSRWTAGAYFTFTAGARRTEYGALPVSMSFALNFVRYF